MAVGYNVGQQFASISCASSGSNTIVAAVSGKRIRVLSFILVCDAAVAVTFKSSTTSSLTGAMSFAANSGVAATYNPFGLFQTVAGEALTINLGGAVQTSGSLVYVLE